MNEPIAKQQRRKKRRKLDRVTAEVDTEGGLVTIEPGPMRDREAWLGLLVVPAFISIFVGGFAAGVVGVAISVGAIGAIVVLLFVTSSATHLRWTAGGDFRLYKRNPRRPIWAGRCNELEVETTITQKKNRSIAYLRFAPSSGQRGAKHYYPLTPSDTSALMTAAKTANMRHKDFHY